MSVGAAVLCLVMCLLVEQALSINYNALNKNEYAFTVLGRPNDVTAWGYEHYGGDAGGRIAEALEGPTAARVFSTERAFAVLMLDGSVVCYGSVAYGGDCHRQDSGHGVNTQLNNIRTISATRSAFAAINEEGKIITWGVAEEGGASADYIQYWNDNKGNFTDLISSNTAFAAVSDDIILSWGEYPASDIAHATPSFANLDSTRFVQSNKEAFIAVNRDGTGFTWGNQTGGGNSDSVTLTDIDAVFTTDYAFAVLKTDGTVITWGDDEYGADSSGVTLTNVISITSTLRAFAALKSDGSVETWGDPYFGGDYSAAGGTYAGTTNWGDTHQHS